ncbi:MAG TPA: response regulator transcription factor, partial [Acidimicrobiales bacterium]|nr:response regulator transcription factor [Acidimicrobiales bacterium]
MTDVQAEAIRIVVADDQTAVRDGLVLMLDLLPGITVVGSAANGVEALVLAEEHQLDAMLVDLHMPVLDGIETTRRLTAGYPDVAVVVLTTYADDVSILDALRAGARGYLTKNAGRDDIARAIHGAASGQSVLDSHVQATLLGIAGEPKNASAIAPQSLPDDLTAREGEVLVLIAQGLTNRDIAASLYVSAHTVKTHINHIFAKTGAKSRAEAILYAQNHGLGNAGPTEH